MDSENRDLDPTERAALNALPRELAPPADMEERVVRELRTRRMLGPRPEVTPPRRRALRALIAIAAAAALFVAGHWTGSTEKTSRSTAVATAPGPRYLLLLHEGKGFRGPFDPHDARQRVEEYTRWAVDLHRTGRLVTGEELGSDGWLLSPGASVPMAAGGDRVGGYFVIVADSAERAREIAATCPGLRYGTTIELRPIQKT